MTAYRFIVAYNWTTEKETSNNSTDGICSVTRTEELGVLSRDYQLTVFINIEYCGEDTCLHRMVKPVIPIFGALDRVVDRGIVTV
jgi:hypothetical protein